MTVWEWEKEMLILRVKALSQNIYRVTFSHKAAIARDSAAFTRVPGSDPLGHIIFGAPAGLPAFTEAANMWILAAFGVRRGSLLMDVMVSLVVVPMIVEWSNEIGRGRTGFAHAVCTAGGTDLFRRVGRPRMVFSSKMVSRTWVAHGRRGAGHSGPT
jgi:hypothetical protein